MGERRRSHRAVANDKAILAAAVEEIVRVGVDRVSLRDVGRVAGLTHGATYARYEDVSELLIEVWNATLSDRLVAMYTLAYDAAERPGSRTVGDLSDFIRRADSRDHAAIEMLLVSRRLPTLFEETEHFIHEHLELDEALSATHSRAIILFGVVMVQIFSNAQFGFDIEYQSALEKLLIETLGSPEMSTSSRDATTTVVNDFDVSDARDFFSTDQGFKADLQHAAYEVIGRSGYVGATISRIARRSKCSPALVYKLHRSKEDLVMSAFTELIAGRQLNESMMAEVLSAGFFADILHTEASDASERRRNFSLETALAAGHSDTMRSFILGELIQGASARTVVGEKDDGQYPRRDYAVRTVIAVVISVSWLATITNSTQSLDMHSFAEPLRCGLQNQWLPERVHPSRIPSERADPLDTGMRPSSLEESVIEV
jgi:AcrR family transcriptional regulator